MSKEILQATAAMNDVLRKSGSVDPKERSAAIKILSVALQTPLRQGIMSGDITGNIFQRIKIDQGSTTEFPLDFLAPGTEKDYAAYTIPGHGRLPERPFEGDYIMVPVFEVGNTIDWTLKYARDARWDVVTRATNVLRAGFTKKTNDDAWHLLMAAGVDRNIVVYDSDASVGQFTKRLVSLMKTVMRRNGGGNSTSANRGKLTDLYLSPESLEDIRNWGVDQVDEVTRREIMVAADGAINRIFNVNLHDLDELGEGQEYQKFFLNELAGSLATGGDVELVVGLDLSTNDSFVMPIREELQVFEDENFHRQRRAGLYAWEEHGFGCLDNRRVILGSL
jgi:hypothetical protein